MNNTCFCAYVTNESFHSMGTSKLIRSAEYFYPEIPFILYSDGEIEEYKQQNIAIESMQPFMIRRALEHYEKVIYIDADSMIVGKMDELFSALEKDKVICVRNNNDLGMGGSEAALTQSGREINNYLNAGFVATSDHEFIEWWRLGTLYYSKLLPFGSQSVLNVIINRCEYNLIDNIDSSVYYGVSSLSGDKTHWDSWKEIMIENGELILNNKKVKVIHHAGGFGQDKLNFNLFSDRVRQRLEEIIK